MMDWSQIDDDKFEELACAYARDTYREYKWVPTGKSWDGNKDASFRDKIDGLNYFYQGWCEAKYTANPDSSIPKSHMDSTLVSGVLDGEVIFILFVTNGKITNSFIQRATAILKPHKIQIKFVDGGILTDWINANPTIREDFFTGKFSDGVAEKLKIDIVDYCVLDSTMSAPSLISSIKKMRTNNEYFLYLNLYANHQTRYCLEIDTNALTLLPDRIYEDSVSPGYNSVLIKCLARYPFNGNALVSIRTGPDSIFAFSSIPLFIEDADDTQVIYSKQQRYIQEIYETAKADIYRNTILTVTGHEGCGKSHLLNQVLQSLSKEDTENMRLAFSEKEAENASSICRLLLFINFGFLYDLSHQAFKTLIGKNTNLSPDIFLQLKEGASDQITALNIIDSISEMIATTDMSLFPDQGPMLRRNKSYIVADDFQKVTKRHRSICQHILTEFVSRNYAQIMIIGYRPGEFRVSGLELTLSKLYSGCWKLLGISNEDAYDSLKLCFHKDIAELSKLFPAPISVLHLVLLLKKLKQKNILRYPHEKRVVIYSTAYKETNVNDTALAMGKIKHCRYKDILYVIYKIESGVPIYLLEGFFGKKYSKACVTFGSDLLFKEENESLKPYHDIYLNAFTQIPFSPRYMDALNQFLQYCIEQNVDAPILKSNILSILIDKNNRLRTHYLASAKEICQDYYARSQYIAAQNLASVLLPDMERTPYVAYQYNDLELLYIYAQSIKYANTHAGSSKYLEKISDIGNALSLNSGEMGVVYEAHSELITNYLYALDFHHVEKELIYFRESIKNVTRESSEHKINACLNFENRNMLYVFFSDKPNLPDVYQSALNESARLGRDDYEAYAKMDYAKMIFREDPTHALELLNEALAVFKKYPKCAKREIDCLFEMAMVNYLNQQGSSDELYTLQRLARQNNFAHVYARITITLLTVELLNGVSPKDIELKLDKLIVEYTDLQNTNRLNYFVNQLRAGIYHKLGDAQKQASYLKQQLKNTDVFPSSYIDIVQHNYGVALDATLKWAINGASEESTVYLLDPRIW